MIDPLERRKLRILNDSIGTRIWFDGVEIDWAKRFELKQNAGEFPTLIVEADVTGSAEIDATVRVKDVQLNGNVPEAEPPKVASNSEITREEQAELIAKMLSQSDGGINAEELTEREKLVMLSLLEGGTVVHYTWFDRLLLRLVAVVPGIVGGLIGYMIGQILF